MASKIQIKKIEQGYTAGPSRAICSNCDHYTSKMVTIEGAWSTWTEEKNKRCGLGGFAVKKTATCNMFTPKGEA